MHIQTILHILVPLLLMLPLFGALTPANLNSTNFAPILKELYTKQRIEDLVLGENRFLRYLARDKNFSGKKMPIPIKYGLPQGASHDWTRAKTNINPSLYTDFYLTVGQDFGFVQIDHKALKAARNDLGSFLRAKEPEIDGMFKTMGRRLSIELYGSGAGARAQISAPGASTTVTLVDHRDITKFEPNQVIQLASDNPAFGAAGAGVRTGRLQILTINYDNGTFTVDQNITAAIAAATDLDFIYVDGDYGTAGARAGLAAWFPSTAPTPGDSFFGVDRSTNPVRLAGVRYDAASAGDSPVEGLVKLLSKIAVHAKNTGIGLPDAVWCDPSYWTACELELGPKTVYYDPADEAVFRVGASAIRINYEGGSVPLMSDIDCPANRVYATNHESLKLYSMGESPALMDDDGNEVLRDSTSNSLNIQGYAYDQLACDAPLANGVGLVAAQASLFG